MTKLTLNLTFEELKTLDKYVELNDETRPLFDKIKNAYPKPETLLDVIRNLGYSYDCCYEIVDAVEEFEKSKEPEEWDIKVETDYLTGKARHKWNIVDKDGNDYKPTPQEPEDDEWTIEKLQEKNWYVDAKTLLKSNWEPKPKTPEETEKSLRTAFGKAQQTEKWKEIQKLIDEEDNDKNFKNSLDLIREWGEKNKPPTLKELLWEWWEDIFTRNSDLDADASIDILVDMIDKKFIPPSSDRNGYEWEKCLKMMREKLR
jgi:hypothetical protein